MGIRKYIFQLSLLVLLLSGIRGWAQDNSYLTAYNNGKHLFQIGKFELAMEALKPAMADNSGNEYASYASFYYAISAYSAGYKALARDMFMQINTKFPSWRFSDETTYWISVINFEEGNLDLGMQFASQVVDTSYHQDLHALKLTYLQRSDSMELFKSMFIEYPYDNALAEVILKKMDQIPLEEKDFALLEQVAVRQGWDVKGITVPSETIKKDLYRVAVMFPFIFQNMEASGFYLRKSLVVDMYEGIRQGAEYLRQSGVNIELYAYDTKGDSLITSKILEKPELKQMDLIIGPLVNGPSKLANKFSFENQINIINPVSNNAGVFGNNPYAYLLNPSTITLGKRAAEFAIEKLENKNTLIFHGVRDTDLQMAEAFNEEIQLDSFNVLAMRRIHKDSAELIYRLLTKKQAVRDSLGQVVYDEETELPVEELVIPTDSIGSIFLATFDFKIASEIFSAVAERGDSIQVIGHGRWLSDRTANYLYMERLGIWLLSPNYVDYSKPAYSDFVSTYLFKQHKLPSDYVLLGFESMLFSGYCLNEFGKYFQNGLNENVLDHVSLYQGYDFRNSHDNQWVPILKFEELDLVIQNPQTLDDDR